LNNLYYYYIPTNNNKLFSLLSIIETSFVGDKILFFVKKKEEITELVHFFKTKGILTAGFVSAADFEIPADKYIDLYITTEDNIEHAKLLSVQCVVSLSCSLSVEECKKKAAVCARPEKQILIELIAKSDFPFVQSLYKFAHVEVNRFATVEKDIIEKNKDSRTARFIEYSLSSAVSDDTFAREKNLLTTLLSEASLDQLKKLYVDLLSESVYGQFPKMNELLVFPSFKIPKESKFELNKGSNDGLSEEKIKAYLGGLEHFLPQYILDLEIAEDKTVMTLNLRELSLQKINEFISANLFDGVLSLEVKVLDMKHEKMHEKDVKSEEGDSFGEEKSFARSSSQGRDGRRSSGRSSYGRSYDRGGSDRGNARFGERRRFGGRENRDFGRDRNREEQRDGEFQSSSEQPSGERRYSRDHSSGDRERGGFKRFGQRSFEKRGGSFGGGYDGYKSGDRDNKRSFSREKSFFKKEEFPREGGSEFGQEKERSFSRDGFFRKNDQKFDRRGDYQAKRRRDFQPRRDDSGFFSKRDRDGGQYGSGKFGQKKSRYGAHDDVDYADDQKVLS
jgi:hypothetical protein